MSNNNEKFINQGTPEERLGDFYDETKADSLKKKLESDSGAAKITKKYNKKRQKFIEEGMNEEQINKMLEDNIEKATFDDLTGLKRREKLFEKNEQDIRVAFGIARDEVLTDEEWKRKLFNDEEITITKNINLLMSDVSFLSVANRTSHADGDELLKNIAAEMKRRFSDSFRHGGDEITSIFIGGQEELTEKIKKTKKSVSEIENLAVLNGFKLKPNIDIDSATLNEAIELLRQINSNIDIRDSDKKGTLKLLQNLWLDIADKRSSITKAKERINMLVERRSDKKDKKKIILNDLRKSAYDIRDEKLDKLVKLEDDGTREKAINKFIKKGEKSKLEKEVNRFKRLKTALILEKLNILKREVSE